MNCFHNQSQSSIILVIDSTHVIIQNENVKYSLKLNGFFFLLAVLCMATSALAAAGPLLCSFISFLPPAEQAQHFKSCFPAAGRKLSGLLCMISSIKMG